MSPTGDLLVTPIFLWGDVASSLLRHSYVLPWHGTSPGAAHPKTNRSISLSSRRKQRAQRNQTGNARAPNLLELSEVHDGLGPTRRWFSLLLDLSTWFRELAHWQGLRHMRPSSRTVCPSGLRGWTQSASCVGSNPTAVISARDA